MAVELAEFKGDRLDDRLRCDPSPAGDVGRREEADPC